MAASDTFSCLLRSPLGVLVPGSRGRERERERESPPHPTAESTFPSQHRSLGAPFLFQNGSPLCRNRQPRENARKKLQALPVRELPRAGGRPMITAEAQADYGSNHATRHLRPPVAPMRGAGRESYRSGAHPPDDRSTSLALASSQFQHHIIIHYLTFLFQHTWLTVSRARPAVPPSSPDQLGIFHNHP